MHIIMGKGNRARMEEDRIKELVAMLNKASLAYYNAKDEIMTNYEWDAAYDELIRLEEKTGYVLPDSPTRNTGAQGTENENREKHEYPALSLAKTKSVAELQKWAGDRDVWLSWKLDGITLVLTYDNGSLSRILTRGNGQTGTNITFMKEAIYGIPLEISDKGHFVVRGEAVISYPDFNFINSTMEVEKYSNPRNLAAGTLGLDIKRLSLVKARRVHFNAFTLVHCEREMPSWGERMDYLEQLGFTVVEHERTNAAGLPEIVRSFSERVENGSMDIPVDGLVICYDDIAYAMEGSVTGHHATNAGLAFKWQDVSAETTLLQVEWSCAASTISPIAIFTPVRLEGTTVSRASLCNISEMKRLGIGENGKTILEIIKANKIIPKCIAVKKSEGTFEIPSECPVCKAATQIQIAENSGTETLHCTNPDCSAKHIKKYQRFVSKAGLDIDGFSVETIVKFLNANIISDFSDLFFVNEKKEAIVTMEGFGEKSFANLSQAVEKSRDVEAVPFIYALCIPMIGTDAAKKIVGAIGFQGFLTRLKTGEGFDDIDGIGPEKSGSILQWYAEGKNREQLEKILGQVHIKEENVPVRADGRCEGLIFVVTGSLHHFANRGEIKAYIESQGGSVTGSVSGKTSFLVNNDTTSGSSKNVKAKALGIPIISEEEFIERWAGNINV